MNSGKIVIFSALLATVAYFPLVNLSFAAAAGVGAASNSFSVEQDNRKTLAFAMSLLTPAQRAELETKKAEFKQRLDIELDRVNKHPNRDIQIAQFLSRNLKDTQSKQKELPVLVSSLYSDKRKLDENPRGYSFLRPGDLNRHAAQIAVKLVEIDLRQKATETASRMAPLASEAYARAQSGSKPGATVASIAKGLQDRPCEMSKSRPNANPIALRNISVGMSREEVVGAACASGPQARAIETTGIGTNLLSLGSNVPASSKVTLCFDCDDGNGRLKLQGADRIQVSFDDRGRSVAIRRAQTFYAGTNASGNGQTQPYKLGLLLGPMEAKLGKPSFIYNDGFNTRVGWVYQNGKSPLPQQFWYYEKAPLNKAVIQIDAAPQPTDGPGLSRQQLQRLNPQASYCIAKYLIDLPRDEAGVHAYFEYGRGEQGRDLGNDYSERLRRDGLDKADLRIRQATYDPKYEAAGKTDRCGTIIFAKFKKNEAVDFDVQPVTAAQGRTLDRNANVYSITMDLIDADAIEAGNLRRTQLSDEAASIRTQEIEKAARSPAKAFVP